MILPGQTIRRLALIKPCIDRAKAFGVSYGLGPAGYDIRLAQHLTLYAGQFALASSMEQFTMPTDVLGIVHDKSTWARLGISVFNTVIEPGWRGFLTLELSNHSQTARMFYAGTPIAQVVFHRLEEPTEQPYEGKYQDQSAGPAPAILEN